MQRKRLGWLSLITLLLMGASVVPVLYGTNRAISSMFNAPVRWIPADSPTLSEFREFTERFNVHELVLISWPGCTIDDPRLQALADEVQRVRRERREAGLPELVSGTPNGYETLRELTEGSAELPRAAAVRRLQNVLIGPDGQTTCGAFELTPLGAKLRGESVEIVLEAADRAVGLARDEYRVAGPPVDGIAIDQLSIRSIETFALPSAMLSLALCWICLRSLWFTLPVVAVAALGQGMALAAVYYSGANMNAVLIVLPPLVFVLTVSAGVHLVNYFFEAIRGGNHENPTAQAIAHGWRPGVLSAVTTAIGLGSLVVSDVAPVRQFGVLGALAVLATVGLLFLLLPGAMEWWPGRRRMMSGKRFVWPLPKWVRGPSVWDLLTWLMRRWSGWVAVLTFVTLAVFGYGLTRVTTTLDVVSLLSPETRAVQDYHWFQENVTPLVPVEVVLRFDQASPTNVLDRAELAMRVHAEIMQVDMVRGAISALTFMPPLPRGGGIRAVTQRAVYETRLEDQLDRLVETGYLRIEDGDQFWRISGRVEGRGDIDYGRFLDRVRERVDPLVAEVAGEGVDVTYTGVTSAVYEVQRTLLADLYSSFVTAVLLVGGVMALSLRSVTASLIAMVPNVLPSIILFGAMGWMDWPVDIGSLMTASVALGIAVDGTFHFLATYTRHLSHGCDRLEAIARTYVHCGRALVQTTLICAVGMLAFTSSDFLPARSFAWMLVMLLVVATLADLVVLPALLSGPLGRLFSRKSASESSSPQ